MNRLYPIKALTDSQRMIVRERLLGRMKKIPDGCWIILPGRTGPTKRYPILKIFGKVRPACVWSYLVFTKKGIPVGTAICHTCDNDKCANPKHLWLGNESENASDAYAKARRKSPWIKHPSYRTRDAELALGRRRILIRWHGVNWKRAYKKFYGLVPKYLPELEKRT